MVWLGKAFPDWKRALLCLAVLGASVGCVSAVQAQSRLDAVFARGGIDTNQVCSGDGMGGFFSCADVSADTNNSLGVALSLLDGDSALDAIFGNSFENVACLGDGMGGFSSCADVSADRNTSLGVALGLLDDDANLDAVFANDLFQTNRVCLGDGMGGFPSCADVSADMNASIGVALGALDDDGNLDAVFANDGENRVCLGDGVGGFSSCADVALESRGGAAVALGNLIAPTPAPTLTPISAPTNTPPAVARDSCAIVPASQSDSRRTLLLLCVPLLIWWGKRGDRKAEPHY